MDETDNAENICVKYAKLSKKTNTTQIIHFTKKLNKEREEGEMKEKEAINHQR